MCREAVYGRTDHYEAARSRGRLGPRTDGVTGVEAARGDRADPLPVAEGVRRVLSS